MAEQQTIPLEFYLAAGCTAALFATNRALREFLPVCTSNTEHVNDAITVIAGLIDAQEDVIAKMTSNINNAENHFLQIGLRP